jgi:uroporphyrinogen-III synthase
MRVLVTRPLPDAETTAADLRRRGHEPIVAPMLETRFIDWSQAAAPEPALPDAIVATSPNGIRGLGGHPDIARLRHIRLFVTGSASARLADSLGFTDVRSAQGNVLDVLALIDAEMSTGCSLLYAAGYDRSGDLGGELKARGYSVDLIEVYRAMAATNLSELTRAELRAGRIDRILIFSTRTAEALVSTLRDADLLAVSRMIPIHAISQQAAEPLISAGFRSIIIALRPDAAELLDTLESSR